MLPRAAILAMMLAAAAPGQDDLPPGVLLLSRIKRHISEQIERLPDYTCLQTSARYRFGPKEKEPRPADILVLEVLNARDHEMYASPGARDFRDKSPNAIAAGGLTGTGMFGLFLRTIFVLDNAMSKHGGEEEVAGRKAVRYDYRVPVTLSGYSIQVEYAKGRAAMKGSFWVDPETLDLVSLEVDADDISPNLLLASATQTIDYARTRIGDRDVILPQSATLRLVGLDGKESRNVVEFTHCRSFTAESKLSFDAAPPLETSVLPAAAPPKHETDPVPPGLVVSIELSAPITEKQTVGELISAHVGADVMQKGKVVLARGAEVRGRIRRLERQEDYYVVSLEFTDVETRAGAARFYANLQDIDQRYKQILTTSIRGPRGQMNTQTWAPYLPGVVSFFVKGPRPFVPAAFRTVWKTTSPRLPTR
jgi:hypothetical protein